MRQSENTEGTSCVKDCIAELGIIAIDDDAAVLERIKRFVSEVENTEYLGGFTEPLEGVAYVAEHKVDLVFWQWLCCVFRDWKWPGRYRR